MKIFRVSIKYRDAASQLENSNTEILSLQLLQDRYDPIIKLSKALLIYQDSVKVI